jgi:hypothetical protein
MGKERQDPIDTPVEYLESMVTYYERMITEYHATHLQDGFNKTTELLELFKTNEYKKIVNYYETNRSIGENLGTRYHRVLSFLGRYLAEHHKKTNPSTRR